MREGPHPTQGHLQRSMGHFHPGWPPLPPCRPASPGCETALPTAHLLPRNSHPTSRAPWPLLQQLPAEGSLRAGSRQPLREPRVCLPQVQQTGPQPQEVVCALRSPCKRLPLSGNTRAWVAGTRPSGSTAPAQPQGLCSGVAAAAPGLGEAGAGLHSCQAGNRAAIQVQPTCLVPGASSLHLEASSSSTRPGRVQAQNQSDLDSSHLRPTTYKFWVGSGPVPSPLKPHQLNGEASWGVAQGGCLPSTRGPGLLPAALQHRQEKSLGQDRCFN